MALVGPRPALWNQYDLPYGGVSSTAQTASVRVLPDGHRSMDAMSCRSGKKLNWMDIMCTISSSKWIWNVLWRTAGAVLRQDGIHEEDWKNSR